MTENENYPQKVPPVQPEIPQPPISPVNTPKPSMFVSTLLGGVLLGLLSTIPYGSSVNVVCCAWVILGGFIAAYLYHKDGGKLDKSTGALIGFLAGLWGTVIVTLITTVMWAIRGDSMLTEISSKMQMSGQQMPESYMNLMTSLLGNPKLIAVITFCAYLIIDSVFATLGGLLAVSVVKKDSDAQVNQ